MVILNENFEGLEFFLFQLCAEFQLHIILAGWSLIEHSVDPFRQMVFTDGSLWNTHVWTMWAELEKCNDKYEGIAIFHLMLVPVWVLKHPRHNYSTIGRLYMKTTFLKRLYLGGAWLKGTLNWQSVFNEGTDLCSVFLGIFLCSMNLAFTPLIHISLAVLGFRV